MNLDSLTDLVSNAVGVLILLLLMTTLQARKPFSEPPLPIEHQSGLIPQFLYVYGDGVQSIDVNTVFTNGLLAASETGVDAEFRINADFMGKPDEELTLAISPIETEHWPRFEELTEQSTPLAQFAGAIDRQREFAFVFVHDLADASSYRTLDRLRDWFLDRGVAVGWLPVSDSNPAYLCSWSDVSYCRYSPSYYGRSN